MLMFVKICISLVIVVYTCLHMLKYVYSRICEYIAVYTCRCLSKAVNKCLYLLKYVYSCICKYMALYSC